MYVTRKIKLGRSERLDELAKASAEVWNDTAKWFWRTVRRQGKWLSKYQMFRWQCTGRETPFAAKCAQLTVSSFFQALDAWRASRSRNSKARPPYKQKRFYKTVWDYRVIKLRDDGVLRLSCGRGSDPVLIDWPSEQEPRRVEIGWDGEQYELRAQYKVEPQTEPEGDEVAGIDLGEIHLAAAYVGDGGDTLLSNGRELRSLRRYYNKTKAKLRAKIDRKERGSNRWRKLVRTKKKQLGKISNQITDLLHKQSTRLVDALHERGVSTLAIGDVRDLREGLDYGPKANQRLHQWASGRFRKMLTYKAKLCGMGVALVDEAYTSQTCPHCQHRRKPRGREYVCKKCGFRGHRDAVGAQNIRKKYLRNESEVVGDTAPPAAGDVRGVKYRSHMWCSSRSGSKTCGQALLASA